MFTKLRKMFSITLALMMVLINLQISFLPAYAADKPIRDRNGPDVRQTVFQGDYIAAHLDKEKIPDVDMNAFFCPRTYARSAAAFTRKNIGGKLTEGKNHENIITSMNYISMIYDPDPGSAYYVTMADISGNNDQIKPYCTDVIYNNNSGETLKDCYYDRTTRLLYIPKHYIDSPEPKDPLIDPEAPIAFQTSYTVEDSFCKEIDVTAMGQKAADYSHQRIMVENMFDTTTRLESVFQGPNDYEEEDLLVLVNGTAAPLHSDQFIYDGANDTLVINGSAATISSVTVMTKPKSLREKIGSFFGAAAGRLAEPSYAIKYEDMSALRSSSGELVYLSDENGDLYDELYVGWRGSYNSRTQDADTIAYYNTRDLFKKLKNTENSSQYLYAADRKNYAWALMSYAKGINLAVDSNSPIKKDAKITDWHKEGSKTIYEWFNEFRVYLLKFVNDNPGSGFNLEDHNPNNYYSINADGAGQGAMTFAFRFPEQVNGEESLVDSAHANAVNQKKVSFRFMTDELDNEGEGVWLAGWCRHFNDNENLSDKVGTHRSKIWMTCLGKGKDATGRYVVLEWASDEPVYDQTGAAIYKIYVEPPAVIHETKAECDADDPEKVTISDQIRFKKLHPGRNYTVKSILTRKDEEGYKPVVIGGKSIECTTTFQAEKEEDICTVTLPSFAASDLEWETNGQIRKEPYQFTVVDLLYLGSDTTGKVMSIHNEKHDAADQDVQLRNPFGKVQWKKLGRISNTDQYLPETDAMFRIWNEKFKSYEAAEAASSNHAYAQTLTQKGAPEQVLSGLLAEGTYRIEQIHNERARADGFIHLAVPETVEIKAGQTVSLKDGEWKNDDHILMNLKIHKLSCGTIGGRFEDADLLSDQIAFKIESVDDDGSFSGAGYEQEVTLTKDGTVDISGLEAGKYRITESFTSPIGYYLEPDQASLEITLGTHEGTRTIDEIEATDGAITSIEVSESKNEKNQPEYDVVWTRKNLQQNTTLSIHKERQFVNEAEVEERKAQPSAEFNLYAKGDIVSYDGHGDHIYYKDGDLIQGMLIDQDTGERTFYVDGNITEDQSFRIITDENGDWDSANTGNPYYPLTNQDSYYVFKEVYTWTQGDHISFDEEQKGYLTSIWKEKLEQDPDQEIEGAGGLTFRQVLNHGIDLIGTSETAEDTRLVDGGLCSVNGMLIEDEMLREFISSRILEFIDSGDSIVNENKVSVGTIERDTQVLDPTEAADKEKGIDEFQVLPFDCAQRTTSNNSAMLNDTVPKLATVAECKTTGTNVLPEEGNAIIIDHVEYENLVPGKTYDLRGMLFDRTHAELVKIDGDVVTVEKQFTPSRRSGSVDMIFKVPAEELQGKTMVVYEELYHNGILQGSHRDPEAKEQTIYTKKEKKIKKKNPPKEKEPEPEKVIVKKKVVKKTESKPEVTKVSTPDTGDRNDMTLYMILIAIAITGILTLCLIGHFENE